MADAIVRSAIVDGPFRYWLERRWDGANDDSAAMIFIMLNPSVANGLIDDPTIRRCISFARREGFNRMGVANLFALVSTQPQGLLAAADPVGPRNARFIEMAAREALFGSMLVVGWGALSGGIATMATRHAREVRLVMGHAPIWCLDLTKAGDPRHPLFVRGDQPLIEWKGYV